MTRAERGDRLASIAAAVVKQDDIPARTPIENCLNDSLSAELFPVVGVNVQSRGDVAEIGGDADGHELVGGRRLGVAEIRRAKECGTSIENSLEQSLVRVELEPRHERRREREIGMREGVIPELVPLGQYPPRERNVALDARSDQKESRRRVTRRQRVEYRRRPARIGAVVESQRDLVRTRSDSLHDVRRRIRRSAAHRLSGRSPDQCGVRDVRQSAARRDEVFRPRRRT